MKRLLPMCLFCFLIVLTLHQVGAAENVRLRLATTTSVENSGLLDHLLPTFEKRFGVNVDVVAVGTGAALKLAENGDVDILFVHDPEAEERFVVKGYGVNRREVAWNDFVVVGPPDDPAGLRGLKSAGEMFQKIVGQKATFVSRGDSSGTYRKELKIWQEARITPKGEWYLETGQGMGATLQIADEKRGYCLTDRGTFLSYKGKLDLAILLEGGQELYNLYSVIAVNPEKHPYAHYKEAIELIQWLTSPEGQRMIGAYQKYGQILFHPYTSR